MSLNKKSRTQTRARFGLGIHWPKSPPGSQKGPPTSSQPSELAPPPSFPEGSAAWTRQRGQHRGASSRGLAVRGSVWTTMVEVSPRSPAGARARGDQVINGTRPKPNSDCGRRLGGAARRPCPRSPLRHRERSSPQRAEPPRRFAGSWSESCSEMSPPPLSPR